MRLIQDLDNLPKLPKTVITIGSFDGVHAGHIKLFSKLKQLSKQHHCENLVITFHPHPRSVVYPKDKSLRLLTTLEEKIELIRINGIDNLVVVPFTIEYSQISPLEYIDQLVEKFNPAHIVIGYDHKFGLNRAGDINLLRIKAGDYNYTVHEISKQALEDITISSTQIRNALVVGEIETANTLLGRAYEVEGTVIKGKKLGTEIGFPTANILVSDKLKLVPAFGIYACQIYVRNRNYKGMLYIGSIPTLSSENTRSIEVNIFDFDQDIYDEKIVVRLHAFLREDEKFDGLAPLVAQLNIDKQNALAFFREQQHSVGTDTTVAILNYNSCELLETFLPSVTYSSLSEFKTLVIDNNSKDDSLEYLETWFPEVEVIQLKENFGFAEGYNQGLQTVTSKYIAFLNSDVQVTEGWLDPLVSYLEAHPECGAVMPKILSFENKALFEYAGAAGGYLDNLAFPFCRGRMFDEIEADNGQYDSEASVAWISGAAFVMRKDIFERFGGFDKDYFAHMEEIDLCWRIRRAGYKLRVIPDAVVFHLGGGTLNYGNSRKVFLNFRNSLVTLYKNETALGLLWKIPFRLLMDGAAGLKFLLSGNPASMFAIVRAHFAFYFSIPKLIGKRRQNTELINKMKIGPLNKDGHINRSVVLGYYLFNKKTFTEFFGN